MNIKKRKQPGEVYCNTRNLIIAQVKLITTQTQLVCKGSKEAYFQYRKFQISRDEICTTPFFILKCVN